MPIVVTEIVEDGIPYRITEDEETGLYIKESLQDVDIPHPPDRIAQLEDENAFLALELASTQARLDQAKKEQADLLLLLVSQGVI